MSKQLWVLAGGNGSGKSTFYHRFLEPRGLYFVNADLLARQLFPDSPEEHSYQASHLAGALRTALLEEGRPFCFETVFSHPSKIDFLAQAKSHGYQITLVFFHLDNAQLNKARVSQRVSEGGHNVPDEKVESRIPRVLENIRKAIPLCDQVRIIDNSRYDDPFRLLASVKDGLVMPHAEPLPDWCEQLLD